MASVMAAMRHGEVLGTASIRPCWWSRKRVTVPFL